MKTGMKTGIAVKEIRAYSRGHFRSQEPQALAATSGVGAFPGTFVTLVLRPHKSSEIPLAQFPHQS
jgi:hypothetical protein